MIPAPFYVVRKNKVGCHECGETFKTRAKYVNHWRRRHMP